MEEEIKIWKVEHPATAKKMVEEDNEAGRGEGDNHGDDGEDGFGLLEVDNQHVSNCSHNSDGDSRNR